MRSKKGLMTDEDINKVLAKVGQRVMKLLSQGSRYRSGARISLSLNSVDDSHYYDGVKLSRDQEMEIDSWFDPYIIQKRTKKENK